jgi:osmoprotectant transport system ATP-binding protein
VLVDNVDLRQTNLIALRRNSGYIIQGGGLFPHRTVYENVATIPRLLRWREEDIRLAADALLETLGIHQLRDRFPRSLSGGEQQRVGIARAMIAKPSLLLCDEPFGALDPIVRRELQDVFRELRSGVTIVFVTHDLAEAMRVCERIVLMDQGRVVNDSTAVQFVQQSLPLVQQFVDAASVRA